jgi:hypothetical protein
MRAESCIDYVEIPVTDLDKAKEFFSALFGWSFELWGDDYMSFNDGRFDGGFRRSPEPAPSTGVLLIFFSTDLERDFGRVQELGATISEAIFPFPGGRRFHFVDPTGNEYAIWSTESDPTNGE